MALYSTLIKRICVFGLILLGAMACNRKTVEVPEHIPTEEEKTKQHLEESFASFAAKLNLEDSADAKEYIVKHSRVSISLDKSIVYDLRQDGLSLLWLRFRHHDGDTWVLDGEMYGGLEFHGTLQPLTMMVKGPQYWEELSDIHVYDNGKEVATLGLEVYDMGYIAVFRFPDGTSYSITTVLLIEPLVDYLLKHVLSTE